MPNSINRRHFSTVAGAAAITGLLGQRVRAQGNPASKPNLILFFPDEVRADALACYGNPVTKTPNFDLLAKQGTRFANCHVQYPVCGASRCSLLTGWPTSVRGHRSLQFFLQPDEPNMFRYLKNAGYDTYFFGKNDALAQATFKDSLTEWHAPFSPEGSAPPDRVGPVTMLAPGGFDRRSTSDYQLIQLAIKILEERQRDRPFCIFLPLLNPHPPYGAPAGFDTMYNPKDVPALVPPNLPKKPSFHKAMRQADRLTGDVDAVLRKVRATYYGQVSYSDWLLGELLEAMERTNHTRDTAIVVASDHGDYAGDYGMIEKYPSGLESCLTHVPLIGRVPGLAATQSSEEMVELYDVMATFLELGGTRATHTNFARSLMPQLRGLPGDPKRAAFTEGGFNLSEPQAFEGRGPDNEVLVGPHDTGYGPKTHLENEQPVTVSRCASIKTRRYTYIDRPQDQSELYDRKNDPHEENNLIDDGGMSAVREDLRQQLLAWYINTSGVPPMIRDPRGLPPFPPRG